MAKKEGKYFCEECEDKYKAEELLTCDDCSITLCEDCREDHCCCEEDHSHDFKEFVPGEKK